MIDKATDAEPATNSRPATADIVNVEQRDAEGRVVERAQFRNGLLNGMTEMFAPNGLVLQQINFV